MSPTPAFIALEPDARLTERILAAKGLVRDQVGRQRYLEDRPHLTLLVNWFPDLDAISGQLSELAPLIPMPNVQLAGWHCFRDDPLTGGHTVVTALDAPSQNALRSVQSRILAAVSPLRDVSASTARYQPHWERLSPLRQVSVERWGFPFTGDDWSPHVSVASIAPEAWDQVWPGLAAIAPHGAFTFTHLVLYRLDHLQVATRIDEYVLATL